MTKLFTIFALLLTAQGARAENFVVCRVLARTSAYGNPHRNLLDPSNQVQFAAYAGDMDTEHGYQSLTGDRRNVDYRGVADLIENTLSTEQDRISFGKDDEIEIRGEPATSKFGGLLVKPAVAAKVARKFIIWTNSNQNVEFPPLQLTDGKLDLAQENIPLDASGPIRIAIKGNRQVPDATYDLQFQMICANREGGAALLATLYPSPYQKQRIKASDDAW
jgi:hypothetical protein